MNGDLKFDSQAGQTNGFKAAFLAFLFDETGIKNGVVCNPYRDVPRRAADSWCVFTKDKKNGPNFSFKYRFGNHLLYVYKRNALTNGVALPPKHLAKRVEEKNPTT